MTSWPIRLVNQSNFVHMLPLLWGAIVINRGRKNAEKILLEQQMQYEPVIALKDLLRQL